MGRYKRAKRNLVILKIFELMEDASKNNYILTITGIPKYVVKFFMDCGLEDYLTIHKRGIGKFTVPVNETISVDAITVLGKHHYKIETSLLVGSHINFELIEEEIDDYIHGRAIKDSYYHLPRKNFLID